MKMLEALEQAIKTGPRLPPPLGDYAVINRVKLLKLLETFRKHLAPDLALLETVSADVQRIVDEAAEQADLIVDRAAEGETGQSVPLGDVVSLIALDSPGAERISAPAPLQPPD